MKIMILAPFSDKRSTIWGVVEGLKAGGHEYVPLETKTSKVSVRDPKFGDFVVSRAEKANVDTVMIGKGTNIPIGIFTHMVERLPDTTYLTFDSVSGNGCGPPNRPDEIGKRGLECDRIILTGTEGARWYRNHGYKGRIAQIYQGCRHRIWRPENLDAPRRFQNQLCFLGSANYKGDGGRRAKMKALANGGFTLHYHKRTFHEDAARLYYDSAICMNFVCGTPGEGVTPVGLTSNRLVRILTAGGFALSERNTDVTATFEEGNQLATFDFGDIQDMLEKTAYWMHKDHKKERLEIARRGWEWSRQWDWAPQVDKMVRFIDGHDIPADGAAAPYVGAWKRNR